LKCKNKHILIKKLNSISNGKTLIITQFLYN
jgi:hypothetical protein